MKWKTLAECRKAIMKNHGFKTIKEFDLWYWNNYKQTPK